MIPENWNRDFKSYQLKGTEKCKASPETRKHGKSAQAQRERHERRMERDREWWEALDE